MVQIAGQARGARGAPGPRLRRHVVHPKERLTGQTPLQAQGKAREIDGQHQIRTEAVDLVGGPAQTVPEAWRLGQDHLEAARRRLCHRERAEQTAVRHVRAAHPGEFERSRRLLPECLHQARAQGVARWLTGDEEHLARHIGVSPDPPVASPPRPRTDRGCLRRTRLSRSISRAPGAGGPAVDLGRASGAHRPIGLAHEPARSMIFALITASAAIVEPTEAWPVNLHTLSLLLKFGHLDPELVPRHDRDGENGPDRWS